MCAGCAGSRYKVTGVLGHHHILQAAHAHLRMTAQTNRKRSRSQAHNTSRARAPKNHSEEDKLYIEPQNENGDMPEQPERLPLLPPHTKLQRRAPPVTILYYILIYKQP